MSVVQSTNPTNPFTGFDFGKATAKQFKQLVADFNEWSKQIDSPPPLDLKDGWMTITPEIALRFLQHTALKGGNRRVSFAAVQYYADQIESGDWQKTGQPIIVDAAGRGIDGQHRCWACVLTNKPFDTFVVASAPVIDNAFVYIDNGKARNATDALETAGLNGQSRVISSVVQLGRRADAGVLTPTGKGQIRKASPKQVIAYVQAHPKLREAVHLQLEEYADATDLLMKDDAAAFLAWKILEVCDEVVLEDFMTKLVATSIEGANTSGDPLVALRKRLQQYAVSDITPGAKEKTSTVAILAHAIKAFNAWRRGDSMKTVRVDISERMPVIGVADLAEAA
jgi:hypothetical protein